MHDQDDSAPGLEVLPRVARDAISAWLAGEEPTSNVAAEGDLARRAAVFVTLKMDGELRGCVGEMEPRCEDLVLETMDRAVAAAIADTRFRPLTQAELDRCTIDVSILGVPETVTANDQLDAQCYGVEVADAEGRRGVLLPAIEGVDHVEQQLAIAREKAGIRPGEVCAVRRFQVTKVSAPSRQRAP